MARQKQRVVLVSGAAGYWGARVAARLMADPGLYVIGLDSDKPKDEIKGLDFIQADIRNPLIAELIQGEQVDTLCHLKFIETAHPSESAFDVNVMGAMKLFGACVEANVRKIVFKSSTAVYGALPDNPSFLTEERSLRGSPRCGSTRDLVEIETFCNGLLHQAPHVGLTGLRFASIIGPTADTPMTRFLKEPLAACLLGFDPMMQVIHEDDVVEALAHAVLNDAPGVFNVAAPGVMPLWRLMALAGKLPLPIVHPLLYWGANLLGGKLSRYAPIEPDYIRYTWVADTARMRDGLGFSPRYTADEALREFAGLQRLSRYLPESISLANDEKRLRDTIERRRRIREQS